MHILHVAHDLELPQWRLVAGCIYQTVWNELTARPNGTGINDYDLIYFDTSDISKESETGTEQRVRASLQDLPAPVEVRNQARVHLWFEDYFGIPYPPLNSSEEALCRYASATHAVGVRLVEDDQIDIFAPFGLADIFSMTIRPNYALPNKATHDRKAERAKSVWPEVTIIPWGEPSRRSSRDELMRCRIRVAAGAVLRSYSTESAARGDLVCRVQRRSGLAYERGCR
jgi:hypothetical protein